jgi:hypothetical protein
MHNFYEALELGSRKDARNLEFVVDETFRLILNNLQNLN